MRERLWIGVLLAALAPGGWAADRQKKDVEPPTQELETFPEPPPAVSADLARLTFHVSPLSARGLLSQQVRDGLRALQNQAGNGTLVRVRAFVAGSGDTRRVGAILSEMLSQRRRPLPSLTVAQVGALPAPGVQVLMEAVVEARRAANPHGLAFFSLQQVERPGLEERMAPLAAELMPKIRAVLGAAALDGGDVVRSTCYLSSMEDVWEVRARVAREFPKAAVSFVQPERAPARSTAACEVVARLRAPVGAPLRRLASEPGQPAPGVLVAPSRVVLTGGQLAFGFRDQDAQLAVERLDRSMEQVGSSLARAVHVGYYVLSRGVAELAARAVAGRSDAAGLPASAVVTCTGLPAIDAGFAVDAIGLAAAP